MRPVKSKLINLMMNACNEASKQIMRDYNELSFLKSNKNVHEFVERTITRSFEIMRNVLENSNSSHGFILSDSWGKFHPTQVYKFKILKKSENGYYWLINPIDNGENFSHRLPFFGIVIAMIENFEINADVPKFNTIAGMFYDPIRLETFWAEDKLGSFLNSRKLRMENNIDIKLVAGSSRKHETPIANTILEKNTESICSRDFGSNAMHLSYLAINRLGAVYDYMDDIANFAVGSLIIKEANGNIIFLGKKFLAINDGAKDLLIKKIEKLN